jgi:hypothetical protein
LENEARCLVNRSSDVFASVLFRNRSSHRESRD